MPPGAVEGGNDGETLFVGRARHEGALIPGKVKPGHSVCYVAWGGTEHGKTDYQVSERILSASELAPRTSKRSSERFSS